MAMKTKMSDLTEHLFEMAERLLDTDDVCVNPEKTMMEIEKSRAMCDIAQQIINVKDVEIKQRETNLKAMQVAKNCGFVFKPEDMNLKELPKTDRSKTKQIGPYGEYED